MVDYYHPHCRQAVPLLKNRVEYILDIHGNIDGGKIVASSSDRLVRAYDSSTFALLGTYQGHKDTITSLACANQSPTIFFTSSADKCVAIWDQRVSDRPICRLRSQNEVQAVAVNKKDFLLATACEEEIQFYDIRKIAATAGAPKLGAYSDLHSNLITHLLFCPNNDDLLISGGEDGLICICNTSIGEAEEAVESVLNTDCAMRRVGCFGPDLEGLYCLSAIETASFWHHPSAQRIVQYNSLREEQSIDYLVDCFEEEGKLRLLAGCFDGSLRLLNVEPHGCEALASLEGGHKEMVRCSTLLSNGLLCTGAEDGQLVGWKRGPSQDPILLSHVDGSEEEVLAEDDEEEERVKREECGEGEEDPNKVEAAAEAAEVTTTTTTKTSRGGRGEGKKRKRMRKQSQS